MSSLSEKPTILYFDCTHNLIFGLTDPKGHWYYYGEQERTRVDGQQIHYLIHEQLEIFQTDLKAMNSLVVCSGPGSYTGMRISEGLAQTFSMANRPVLSFYHFEVPSMTGISQGTWYSKAYKGEHFLHRWSINDDGKLETQQELVSISGEIPDGEGPLFTFEDTIEMVKNDSAKLIPLIVNRGEHKGPFYYRSLEEEYIPNSKGK